MNMSYEQYDECPEMDNCRDYVTEDEFKGYCNTRYWDSCPKCESLAIRLGLKKLPSEWKELLKNTK